MRDHLVDAPAALVEVVARPTNRLLPLGVEVSLVGGVSKLDVDATGVAVADCPGLSVVVHRVVDLGAVQLHDVLHCISVATGVQQHVVVRACAGVGGLMDDQVGRVAVAVPIVDDLLHLFVGVCGAGNEQGNGNGERRQGRDELGGALELALLVTLHPLHRPSRQIRR